MLNKVFKAYDIRGVYPDPLNEEIALKVGCATGQYLRGQLSGRDASDPMLNHVVVGRDMRTHSPKMAKALIEGLRCAGVNVIDVGMVDTSFIYFAVNYLGCCGGIQTTASHNPPNYNGFKISGLEARPIGADTGLNDIQRLAAQVDPEKVQPSGRVEQRDLWDAYREHVLKFLDLKRPLKVAIDASNGMAGVFVPKLFEGLDNLEIIPMNFETNGKFVHEPNPLVPENMKMTQDAVREHGADMGVCFDGDADRCMLTDEQGSIIGCDLMGAVMAKHFLADNPGSAIVYDLRSSKALVDAVEAAGGKPERSRVGHVFMKKVLRDTGGVFGAELSGHMYYRDNYFTDSGAITFAVMMSIVSAQDKPLSALIQPYECYSQSGEMNFKVEDKDAMIKQLEEKYGEGAEVDFLDGITIDCMASKGWWFNVRASNTEPLLRLNLEAKDDAQLKSMLDELLGLLGEPVAGH